MSAIANLTHFFGKLPAAISLHVRSRRAARSELTQKITGVGSTSVHMLSWKKTELGKPAWKPALSDPFRLPRLQVVHLAVRPENARFAKYFLPQQTAHHAQNRRVFITAVETRLDGR